jgi:hypothetical protein
MSNLWDQPGIPHSGWTCVSVYDTRESEEPGDEPEYETCQMCGNERIRFVHVMENPRHVGQIEAGCICAEKMSGDYSGPREREGRLASRAIRRKTWLSRKWHVSWGGNLSLKAKDIDVRVGIVRNNFHEGWWNYRIGSTFGRERYPTVEAAKLALFDELWPPVIELRR